MLQSFHGRIGPVPVLFAHTGAEADNGNRVYAVGAVLLHPDRAPEVYASPVRYRSFSLRDRRASNLSRQEAESAPEMETVVKGLEAFFGPAPFVVVWSQRDNPGDLERLCGGRRTVDLGFVAEYFLPDLESFSPKTLWERLHRRRRDRLSFHADEAAALGVDLLRHICVLCLDSTVRPEAAALRHFLERSDTLFGKLLLHLTQNRDVYFGELAAGGGKADTGDWMGFLARTATRKSAYGEPGAETFRRVDGDTLDALYRDLAGKERDFVYRPVQVEYACHVAEALGEGAVLTIEAGTGTGKTLGYLLPLFAFLFRNPAARAVVSTYTKNLQGQILEQEVAYLRKNFNEFNNIRVSLLKGKSNYLCAWKLDACLDETWRGAKLLAWLYLVHLIFRFREADGDRVGGRIRDLLDRDGFLSDLQREASARTGCDATHQQCPAQVVAAEARDARLIITNHHKLALFDRDPVLGSLFNLYVIDEANHFEQACRSAYGLEVHSRDLAASITYLCGALEKAAVRAAGEVSDQIAAAMDEAQDFLEGLDRLGEILRRIPTAGIEGIHAIPESDAAFSEGPINVYLQPLGRCLENMSQALDWLQDDGVCRLLHLRDRTRERMRAALSHLLEEGQALREMEACMGAPDRTASFQRYARHWVLQSAPVDVADAVREGFYSRTRGMVYTAATLRYEGQFDLFGEIVGLDRPFFLDEGGEKKREIQFAVIPSPFGAEKREIVVYPGAVNGKNGNKSRWIDSVCQAIPGLVDANGGRTLVLFASYRDLEAVASRIGDGIEALGYPLLVQRRGTPTADLCDEFREVRESVLFGVDTFWYGVDFRGETLTQVIITRIPYASPADPLQVARSRTMSRVAYFERYRYDAWIKMEQGIGRLIRSEKDYGKVVVLDTRWRTAKTGGPETGDRG